MTRGSVSCDAGVHGLPIKIPPHMGFLKCRYSNYICAKNPKVSLLTALSRFTPTKRKRKVQTAEYYGPEGRDLKPEI